MSSYFYKKRDFLGDSLHNFIVHTLGYTEEPNNNILFGKLYSGSKEFITVTPFLSGRPLFSKIPFLKEIGFELKSIIEGYTPLEEMIDLEALNNYVLTGEYSTILRRYTGSCLNRQP